MNVIIKKAALLTAALLLVTGLRAQQAPDRIVRLYPEGQGVDKGVVENGVPVTLGPGCANELKVPQTWDGTLLRRVSDPWLRIYLPEKNTSGQMVVICPGGAYALLSTESEGELAARWLNERGIAACVVWYRMPNRHDIVPLTDVQNAFRYCRHHAAEWGVKQIGVMGFSAGGHLAASASTLFTDEITRPDFSILFYPVITMEEGLTHEGTMYNLTGKDPVLRERYSLEKRVTAETPPTILLLSSNDDAVPPENSLRYLRALKAHGVAAQIHSFPTGGHGWGFAARKYTGKKDLIGDEARATADAALETFLRDCRSVPETVLLYPEGQGVNKGIVEDGVAITLGPGESTEATSPEFVKESGNVGNVGDSARMVIYLPEKPNGQMVVICPGGGYSNLAMNHEGHWVAEWLNDRGIAACIVVYRMPRGMHHQAPLIDVQNAFRYCRHHAADWGVRQIGVMGFSAGGHLAACASTLFVDEVTRPDFSILVYPVITFDEAVKKKGTLEQLTDGGRRKDLMEYYSLENRVTEQTPPAILLLSEDDKGVIPEHSWRYFEQLRLHGVQGELHVLPYGGHGWGWKTSDKSGKPDPLHDGVREVFFHCVDNFLERRAKDE